MTLPLKEGTGIPAEAAVPGCGMEVEDCDGCGMEVGPDCDGSGISPLRDEEVADGTGIVPPFSAFAGAAEVLKPAGTGMDEPILLSFIVDTGFLGIFVMAELLLT